MIKRRRKAKRNTPPRYKSGPKKGRFMSKAAVARSRAAKRTKSNPKRRRKVKRNNTGISAHASRVVRKVKRRRVARKATPAVKVVVVRANPPRRKRRKVKTNTTRRNPVVKRRRRRRARRNPQVATAAYRKGYDRTFDKKKTRPKKRKTAKKHAAKKHVRRKKHAGGRPRRGTKAYFSWMGKKGAAARKRKHKKHAATTKAAPKRRRRKSGRVPAKPIRLRVRRSKRSKWQVRKVGWKRTRKTAKRKSYTRFGVMRNPGMEGFKKMLVHGGLLFGGILGMRVVSNLIKEYVTTPALKTNTNTTIAQIAPVLPSAVTFVLAAFAGKVIKKPAVLEAVQVGATVALLDGIWNTFLKAKIQGTNAAALQYKMFAGVNDVGYGGYGFRGYGGEYIAQRQLSRPIQGYGLDVHEAMALDEYVPDRGMGAQVEEALAESEVEGIQRGYAAGSLSKTVFSS